MIYVCEFYLNKYGGKRLICAVRANSKQEARETLNRRYKGKNVLIVSIEKQ